MVANTLAAYGVYSKDAPLHDVVRSLNQSGFGNEQICLMVWPGHSIAQIMREAKIFHVERSATASTLALLEWLMKLGAVIIPGVGFFIRSRAFLRDLVLGKDFPDLCGSFEALMALGFSESEAKRFEQQPGEPGVMVYVACAESSRMAVAIEVMRRTGADKTAAVAGNEVIFESVA
jgi:hypothetical protein